MPIVSQCLLVLNLPKVASYELNYINLGIAWKFQENKKTGWFSDKYNEKCYELKKVTIKEEVRNGLVTRSVQLLTYTDDANIITRILLWMTKTYTALADLAYNYKWIKVN